MAEQTKPTTTPRTVPVDLLSQAPFNKVISYPSSEPDNVTVRVDQMSKLGVESIIFSGPSNINGIPILGKGCVGIVVQARSRSNRDLALKIRRTDANRQNMHMEAIFQRYANNAGIGPRLEGEAPDILAMELVKGETLPVWTSHLPEQRETGQVLKELLKQSFTLDNVGLDHGELSHAHKNVLISQCDPVIIDFESSSTNRRTSNLTSIVQYLFFSGKIAETVRSLVGFKKNETAHLLDRLRQYKKNPGESSVEDILSVLKL